MSRTWVRTFFWHFVRQQIDRRLTAEEQKISKAAQPHLLSSPAGALASSSGGRQRLKTTFRKGGKTACLDVSCLPVYADGTNPTPISSLIDITNTPSGARFTKPVHSEGDCFTKSRATHEIVKVLASRNPCSSRDGVGPAAVVLAVGATDLDIRPLWNAPLVDQAQQLLAVVTLGRRLFTAVPLATGGGHLDGRSGLWRDKDQGWAGNIA
jgi:hypothetical protein